MVARLIYSYNDKLMVVVEREIDYYCWNNSNFSLFGFEVFTLKNFQNVNLHFAHHFYKTIGNTLHEQA